MKIVELIHSAKNKYYMVIKSGNHKEALEINQPLYVNLWSAGEWDQDRNNKGDYILRNKD